MSKSEQKDVMVQYNKAAAYPPDHWALSTGRAKDGGDEPWFVAVVEVPLVHSQATAAAAAHRPSSAGATSSPAGALAASAPDSKCAAGTTCFMVGLHPRDARGMRSVVTLCADDMRSTLNRAYTLAETQALGAVLGLVAHCYADWGLLAQFEVADDEAQDLRYADVFATEGVFGVGFPPKQPGALRGHVVGRGNPFAVPPVPGRVQPLGGPLPGRVFDMRGKDADEDAGNRAVAWDLSYELASCARALAHALFKRLDDSAHALGVPVRLVRERRDCYTVRMPTETLTHVSTCPPSLTLAYLGPLTRAQLAERVAALRVLAAALKGAVHLSGGNEVPNDSWTHVPGVSARHHLVHGALQSALLWRFSTAYSVAEPHTYNGGDGCIVKHYVSTRATGAAELSVAPALQCVTLEVVSSYQEAPVAVFRL